MNESVVERLTQANSLLVITGAGISAESGIPTFRGADGLWRNYRAEDLATLDAFERDPVTVWEWYDWRRGIIGRAEPNPGHLAIKDLEDMFENFLLITQNVDGLHGRTGIRNIVEIHGNLWRTKCTREGKISMLMDVPLRSIPPRCDCGAVLRPDVVWFGESIPSYALDLSFNVLEQCDTLIVVGTSGVVYPVASFPQTVKDNGGYVVEVNVEPTPISAIADASLYGNSGDILPMLVKWLKERRK
ncbi:MAG TPA: NAD-dependent deacylase [Syntrophorhabdus sp.]|jgi:NAD-dependent deacetylase|nr:NAD-dependent deacylase [Syntrophorhabdus sp.]MDI9559261.1 NAD-dependent deacylase [Pseudomonadota bacterium]OPX98149.1 MAG: NAD-dependent protein deacylase [Syntrophorhabdus sp. PtaB.Bin027]OQB77183.1 MAG: NAD-dependent protein deacylase [Deltaproteobacteria bacterium ADurb.Bin135]MBP8745105.1 NAD-dependent deacylase [Syntrophorhabdus sp.]